MARLLTPRFALLTAADLGYFTAMGIAVYTLPLYVTGPLHSTNAAAASRSAPSRSPHSCYAPTPATSPTASAEGHSSSPALHWPPPASP
ncbi:hypothetical protein FXN61_01905 [Lentzea sp. PSKA42]|uniref:Uncharacterized protein n=1 Tax=Lentzea indica TaxID=2604800 RepID=A0ABX1FA79_9PSEU|nr:hypothetical protein [Lentzea indica]NKE55642.1 hypothetical protein [Lentzea indica]